MKKMAALFLTAIVILLSSCGNLLNQDEKNSLIALSLPYGSSSGNSSRNADAGDAISYTFRITFEKLNGSHTVEEYGKSGDQIYGAVRDGTIDFNALAASVENAGGSVEQTFKDTKDPMNELKTVMNELKIVGADIVTSSAPMIKEAVGAVRDVVKDLLFCSPFALQEHESGPKHDIHVWAYIFQGYAPFHSFFAHTLCF
jgi:hypothetical protein